MDKIFYRVVFHTNSMRVLELNLIKETAKQYKLSDEDGGRDFTVKKENFNVLSESIMQDTDSLFNRVAYTTDKDQIDVFRSKYKQLATKHFEKIRKTVDSSLEVLSVSYQEREG